MTALVLAIVAVALCWVPFLGVVAAVVGLTLGVVAWVRAPSGRAGMAVAATIVAGVALVLAIILTVLLTHVIREVVHCADPSLSQAQQEKCVNDIFGITPSSTP